MKTTTMSAKTTIDSGNSSLGYARTVLVRSGRGYRVLESTHRPDQIRAIKQQLRDGETTISLETMPGSGDYIGARISRA